MPMMNRNDEEASIWLVGSQTRGKIWKTTHPRNMDTSLPTAKPPIAKMTTKSNHEKRRQHDNDSTGSLGFPKGEDSSTSWISDKKTRFVCVT
jgi:hypothetical protein